MCRCLPHWFFRLTFGLLVVVAWSSAAVLAQPGDQVPTNEDQSKPLTELDRLEARVAAVWQRSKALGGNKPIENQPKGVAIYPTAPQMAVYYTNNNGRSARHNYLAMQLLIGNRTERAITIKRDDVRIEIDGVTYEPVQPDGQLGNYAYQYDGRYYQLKRLAAEPQAVVEPGETGNLGIVVEMLPEFARVPKVKVRVRSAGRTMILNMNEFSRAELGLNVETVGPEGCVGLLTIEGKLHGINWDVLVSEIEVLVDREQIRRFVITWTDDAPDLPSQQLNNLVSVANTLGRRQELRVNFSYPPQSITEFHLANVPNYAKNTGTLGGNSTGPVRVHHDLDHALGGALLTLVSRLDAETVLQQVREGDPRLRAAMLVVGGSQLQARHLPFVLGLADADDPEMRRAALLTLRHFGADGAWDRLSHVATDDSRDEADRLVAIESLAASRFEQARIRLQQLLTTEQIAVTPTLLEILGRHPQPEWRDLAFRFLKGSPEEGVTETVRLLLDLGHPELDDYLRDRLANGDEELAGQLFQFYLEHDEKILEDVLRDYALRVIETGEPTPPMRELFRRTREVRAVPALLQLLKKKDSNNKSGLMRVLLDLGSLEVVPAILEIYPDLERYEQSVALEVLWRSESPEFFDLAKKALATDYSNLVDAACDGLRVDASDRAVGIMVDALQKSSNNSSISYLCNSLAAIGSPKARRELTRLQRETKPNEPKRARITQTIEQMYRRTPAHNALRLAEQEFDAKNYRKVIRYAEVGLDADPSHPLLHQWKGAAHLELGEFPAAVTHLRKAVAGNADFHVAVARLAIAMVRGGDVTKGINYGEHASKRFANDGLWLYNLACVYGRAVEQASRADADETIKGRIDDYRQRAIALLEKAIDNGYEDLEFLKTDPDLVPLHDLPAFQDIAAGKIRPKNRIRPNL